MRSLIPAGGGVKVAFQAGVLLKSPGHPAPTEVHTANTSLRW